MLKEHYQKLWRGNHWVEIMDQQRRRRHYLLKLPAALIQTTWLQPSLLNKQNHHHYLWIHGLGWYCYAKRRLNQRTILLRENKTELTKVVVSSTHSNKDFFHLKLCKGKSRPLIVDNSLVECNRTPTLWTAGGSSHSPWLDDRHYSISDAHGLCTRRRSYLTTGANRNCDCFHEWACIWATKRKSREVWNHVRSLLHLRGVRCKRTEVPKKPVHSLNWNETLHSTYLASVEFRLSELHHQCPTETSRWLH